MRARGLAAITVAQGVLILGTWGAFVARGVFGQGIRTVENNQYLAFHVAAEVAMGLALLVGGAGLALRHGWGTAVAVAAWGAVVYSAVNALAHAARKEQRLTPVLAGSAALGVAMVGLLGRKRNGR